MGIATGWFGNYSHRSSTKQGSESTPPGSSRLRLASFSSQLWESFVKLLESSHEPRIWQRRDRQGNISWRLYDPATNQSATFASEDEIRIWLEEKYYR